MRQDCKYIYIWVTNLISSKQQQIAPGHTGDTWGSVTHKW